MWKHLKNKFRKSKCILKNKKGFGSLEIIISSFIIVMIIAGLIDMIQITQRIDTTSQAISYVSRVIQKQGGVRVNEPENFNGEYTNSATLYNNIKDIMAANGIIEENWELEIKTNSTKENLTSSTNFPLVDYGNRITITLEVNYHWYTLSTMFPGDIGGYKPSSRQVLSGYAIRSNSGMSTETELK